MPAATTTRRCRRLLAGLLLIAAGSVLTLRAHLGLDPWDGLHDGLRRRTPLSFGQAMLLVSLATLMVTWTAAQRPGIGTVANMLLVGPLTDLLLHTGLGAGMPHAPLPPRTGLLLSGLAVKATGVGLYRSAALDAGPHDAAQLALSGRLGAPVALARGALDCLGLVVGILLAGNASLGTAVSVAVVAPTLAVCFRLLGLDPTARVQHPKPAVQKQAQLKRQHLG
jgi:uncharacterized membrane protein YczE